MSSKLLETINYIVERGVEAILSNTDEWPLQIDYLAIFSRDQEEFNDLLNIVINMGSEVEKQSVKTGKTYLLHKPIGTKAGELKVLKIRLPDPTRTQRGAPDFRVKNYDEFKNKYLQKSGNFTLMVRRDLEMIELKGVDVLVYFPNNPVGLKYS